MITDFKVSNFKSVESLSIQLGRVTVLIGENGSGKSNILEALMLAGAAAANKLDNEFLVSRGIRTTDERMMLSAFTESAGRGSKRKSISFELISSTDCKVSFTLKPTREGWAILKNESSPRVEIEISSGELDKYELPQPARVMFRKAFPKPEIHETDKGVRVTVGPVLLPPPEFSAEWLHQALSGAMARQLLQEHECSRFVIYAPENTMLRRFEEEGQIQPVGIRGEGLFKMLQGFARENRSDRLGDLKRSLGLVGWFFDFEIPPNLSPGENRVAIFDRFLGPNVPFDQRSANEGFLYLIFYFSVFLSDATPVFFAIDNIDSSLNPKLCAEMMRQICQLAARFKKQVIVTTHNPAILDGLDLTDEQQRLYTVFRDQRGATKVRHIPPPRTTKGETPMKLSHAFLEGLIGGLPKNF